MAHIDVLAPTQIAAAVDLLPLFAPYSRGLEGAGNFAPMTASAIYLTAPSLVYFPADRLLVRPCCRTEQSLLVYEIWERAFTGKER